MQPAPAPANGDGLVAPPHGERVPLLSLRGMTKRFPNVLAVDNVDFDLRRGEVHALLGENGAGKSTLMKMIYGFYQPDAGRMFLDGSEVRVLSPHDARRLAIGMVFQNFTLISRLTVLENVALYLPRLGMVLRRGDIAARIRDVSSRYGLDVEVNALIWQLSAGQQQKVEVIKLLLAQAQVLIFDEPTSVLAPQEIEGLFQVFNRLRSDGYAVVFITHKLREALACADRITVMRQGRLVGTLPRGEAREGALVSLMFGAAEVPAPAVRTACLATAATPLLELRDVVAGGQGTSMGLKGLSLTVSAGEIVGVAGVSGNGQRELGDVILGAERCSKGSKFLFGEDATHWPIARVREKGVAFIPESPLWMGAVPTMTVLENLVLDDRARYSRHSGLAMDWQAVRKETGEAIQRTGIKIAPFEARVSDLSGGNVQRLIFVRELIQDARLLVAFYPTHGLDVPSALSARAQIMGARNSGKGVLLVSGDLNELFELSDRLVVLYKGRVAGVLKPGETSFEEVGRLMTGASA